jgi:hypothetical protein
VRGALHARTARRPQAALALARDNWAVQKELPDLRLLLETSLAASTTSRPGQRTPMARAIAQRRRRHQPPVAIGLTMKTVHQAGSLQVLPGFAHAAHAACRASRAGAQAQRQLPQPAASPKRPRSTVSGILPCATSTTRSASTTTRTARSPGANCAPITPTSPLTRWRGSTLSADGEACPTAVVEHLVDDHSDGAYAVLRFSASCPAAAHVLSAGYRLFFDVDPQHRGLLRLEHAGQTHTAIFSYGDSGAAIRTRRTTTCASSSTTSRTGSGTSGSASIICCFCCRCCCRRS